MRQDKHIEILQNIISEKDEEIKKLKFEIEILRDYGNKDCTYMADQYLANPEKFNEE